MSIEIERKFLVKDTTVLKDTQGVCYRQGYLVLGEHKTVRVRTNGQQAYLTIKGPTVGMSRAEFEYEIPIADANAMLGMLCHQPIIEKTRYKILHDGFVWEVDVFAGANTGLVMAEVELKSEQTHVTHDTNDGQPGLPVIERDVGTDRITALPVTRHRAVDDRNRLRCFPVRFREQPALNERDLQSVEVLAADDANVCRRAPFLILRLLTLNLKRNRARSNRAQRNGVRDRGG